MKPLAIFASLLCATNAVLWAPINWRLAIVWLALAVASPKVAAWSEPRYG